MQHVSIIVEGDRSMNGYDGTDYATVDITC